MELTSLCAADAQRRPCFPVYKVGQSVGLKDHGTAFEISVLDDDIPQSHKVIEIGEDYFVLEDMANVTKATIPVYSLKAIVRLKTK